MNPADPETRRHREDVPLIATVALVSAALAGLVCLGYTTGLEPQGPFSPAVLCWLLVAGGIAGTYAASSGGRLGWLFLFGLQPLWIAYALVTGQAGLVLGCLFSAAAHVNGFLRRARAHCVPCTPCSPAPLEPVRATHTDHEPGTPV